MSLILYPKNEKLFDSNGIGILSDSTDAEVYEVLNGQFELTVKYPVSGIHFAEIVKNAIITAKPNPVSDPQPFEIYRITKPMNKEVTIYARHVAYKLRKITVSPFSAESAPVALQGFKNNAVNDCPFEFWTDKSTAGGFTVKVPTAAWTLMGNSEGSILDTFGGEYEFDKWTVKLHNRRGADRGVSIRYGKNLTSLEQDENCANVCTGVYPYWADMEGNVVMLSEKVVMIADEYEDELIMPLDLSQSFETAPTEEQLRAKTKSYIKANDIGKPDVSWTVEFVQLEQTEEYKGKALLERVLLGDTVSVVFPKLGVDVSARAVAARYKPLLGRYKNITLGKVRANIADTIVQQGQSIEKKPSVSLMQSIIMTLTASILGARGGAVRLLDTDGDGMPDTLYVADNADPALAKKVWRWNYEGWAGSKTGYNGPFTIGATLEDGLLAEAVTAAQLVAGTIKSKDGKTFFLDLDNGILKMQATEFYVSGKTVDEIAQEKADAAEDNAVGQAVDIAQGAVDAQTQQDIFNKLTNNGANEGLYIKDGKLYINASYIMTGILDAALITVKNLIADHLLSVNGISSLEINGAKASLKNNHGETFSVYNFNDLAYMYFTAFDANGNDVGRSQFGANRIYLGGTWASPAFKVQTGYLDDGNTFSTMSVDEIILNGKKLVPAISSIEESDGFTCIKYYNGIAEGWGSEEFSDVNVYNDWGQLVSSGALSIQLPSAVTAVPERCELSLLETNTGVFMDVSGKPTQTSTQNFYLISALVKTATVKVGYRVVWRWK